MTFDQIPEIAIFGLLAAGSFKAVLNGTVKRTERIEEKLDKFIERVDEKLSDLGERTARVEARD